MRDHRQSLVETVFIGFTLISHVHSLSSHISRGFIEIDHTWSFNNSAETEISIHAYTSIRPTTNASKIEHMCLRIMSLSPHVFQYDYNLASRCSHPILRGESVHLGNAASERLAVCAAGCPCVRDPVPLLLPAMATRTLSH